MVKSRVFDNSRYDLSPDAISSFNVKVCGLVTVCEAVFLADLTLYQVDKMMTTVRRPPTTQTKIVVCVDRPSTSPLSSSFGHGSVKFDHRPSGRQNNRRSAFRVSHLKKARVPTMASLSDKSGFEKLKFPIYVKTLGRDV